MNPEPARTVFSQGSRNNRAQVKICGLTNLEDTMAAIEAGADALGFNFYPKSARYIDPESAAGWLARLPENILKIAVFVNPTLKQVVEIARLPFIDAAQLHGDESPEFCRSLAEQNIPFIKTLGVRDGDSLRDVPDYSTKTVLLDSRSSNFGGTGQTFPWHFAEAFVKHRGDFQVVLAGGLTPENVAEAIHQVHPFGVDVTSGVEQSPGRKNLGRINAFIEAARSRR